MKARIQALSEETIGHIAAGEVVERPAQVIKELVENSLDAGSTSISITIDQGGFKFIEIFDDGHGIQKDDLPLAIQRHATSKLVDFSDLNEIHTLGFRGEALASISMVSRLTVCSRTNEGEGASITVEFGTVQPLISFGMNQGTSIKVEELFQNTPARLAFQRRPETETTQIVEVIVQHALAHPECSFLLRSTERTLLNVAKTEDVVDRLFDILGQQAIDLIELKSPLMDQDAPGSEVWTGWISTPDTTRGKGDEIHVLVNGRPIASTPFLQSIRRGYKTRLMQGRHPIAVLNLAIHPSEIDVNVHPTKREIRLKHSWRVLERLERAIAHTLEQVPTQPDSSDIFPALKSLKREPTITLTPTNEQQSMFDLAIGPKATVHSAEQPKQSQVSPISPDWVQAAQLTLQGKRAEEIEQPKKTRPVSTSHGLQESLTGHNNVELAPHLSSEERDLHRYGLDVPGVSPINEPELLPLAESLPSMVPLSQFADSYILAQAGDELLMIDQHALHERVRYERLRHHGQDWEAQSKIQPIKLSLTPTQSSMTDASISTLQTLGFHLEEKQGSWYLLAAPQILANDDIEPFLIDLLHDLHEGNQVLTTIEQKKDHVAFMHSCRGAIKANQPLTLPEMRRLLDDMSKIPNPWACVHGRPTALRIHIDDLDHHFGRHG